MLTIHLHTLTALSDKWVHIRRGIGPKVNTVGKVGELNWCSPSRGSLVESYLRRDDRGYFIDACGIFYLFYWISKGREKKPSKMELLLLSRSSGCKFVNIKQALLRLVQQALLGLVQQALLGLVYQQKINTKGMRSTKWGFIIENQHITLIFSGQQKYSQVG